MTEVELIANTLFSETKDTNDAIAIANVIKNRLARPKRFGDSLQKVIFTPQQFSGINTSEWDKAINKNFTSKEQQVYDKFQNIARGVWSGIIQDTTGGADHYYNPDISQPNWGKIYPITYKGTEHLFLKEIPIKNKEK